MTKFIHRILCVTTIAITANCFADAKALTPAEADASLSELKRKYEYDTALNNLQTNYFESQKKMEKARQEAADAKNGIFGSDDQKALSDRTDSAGANRRPAWQRGNSAFDNVEQEDTRQFAFVSATMGDPKNLYAEVNWAGNVSRVKVGDSIIGGSWRVVSVATGSVTVTDGSKTIRLTGAKTDVTGFF